MVHRVEQLMALADEYARGHGAVSDENNYANRAALERALRDALEPQGPAKIDDTQVVLGMGMAAMGACAKVAATLAAAPKEPTKPGVLDDDGLRNAYDLNRRPMR